MDLSLGASGCPARLSLSKRQKRAREGLCFYCGEAGHQACDHQQGVVEEQPEEVEQEEAQEEMDFSLGV